MQPIKIENLFRGLFQRSELWRVFYAFWMAAALISVCLFLALAVMPGLGLWALTFPILVFAGLCVWKLKTYKARVVEPMNAVIRQADWGEQIGIFLFFSMFLGALGWGISLMLLFAIYSGRTNSMMFDWGILRYTLFYGFLFGALMAAFKLADIFKYKKITYALYAILALVFLFSYT